MTIEQEMEATYGPAAKYSEHRRGDVIIYTNEGIVTQGTILWVAAPGEVAGRQHPMLYVVEPEGETDTFPHLVYPGEVIRLAAGQEPVLHRASSREPDRVLPIQSKQARVVTLCAHFGLNCVFNVLYLALR